MRQLTLNEIDIVEGGVDQATAIGGNLAIAGIGISVETAFYIAGTAVALTPVGWVVFGGLTLASVALTATYLLGC